MYICCLCFALMAEQDIVIIYTRMTHLNNVALTGFPNRPCRISVQLIFSCSVHSIEMTVWFSFSQLPVKDNVPVGDMFSDK